MCAHVFACVCVLHVYVVLCVHVCVSGPPIHRRNGLFSWAAVRVLCEASRRSLVAEEPGGRGDSANVLPFRHLLSFVLRGGLLFPALSSGASGQ